MSTAHAGEPGEACPAGTVVTAEGACIEAERITRAQAEPSFGEALKIALGRGGPAKKYTMVVGVTENPLLATAAAKKNKRTVLAGSATGFSNCKGRCT